jgi:8-oxo-dGTP diphosphatase
MLKYTICFIKRRNQILMLNRNAEPGMGKWNGVGGKIEAGETPYESVIRETLEETDIQVEEIRYSGAVTWISEHENSGMYAFIAEVPDSFEYLTPRGTVEGILAWKNIDWITNEKNQGVLHHVNHFLLDMLGSNVDSPCEYRFVFNRGQIIKCDKFDLTDELRA